MTEWSDYYDVHNSRTPRALFLKAIALLPQIDARAIDIGFGNGIETAAMLQRGWTVTAIDSEPESERRLHALISPMPGQLITQIVPMEQAQLPSGVDFVHAGYSLPFCPPNAFPDFWGRLTATLKPGGLICGELFGNRDTWSVRPDMTCHTSTEAEALLNNFDLIDFTEVENDKPTATGAPKHWHIYKIIARKRSSLNAG